MSERIRCYSSLLSLQPFSTRSSTFFDVHETPPSPDSLVLMKPLLRPFMRLTGFSAFLLAPPSQILLLFLLLCFIVLATCQRNVSLLFSSNTKRLLTRNPMILSKIASFLKPLPPTHFFSSTEESFQNSVLMSVSRSLLVLESLYNPAGATPSGKKGCEKLWAVLMWLAGWEMLTPDGQPDSELILLIWICLNCLRDRVKQISEPAKQTLGGPVLSDILGARSECLCPEFVLMIESWANMPLRIWNHQFNLQSSLVLFLGTIHWITILDPAVCTGEFHHLLQPPPV